MKMFISLICVICILETTGRNVEGLKPPREFSLLPGDVKTNVCQKVLAGLARKDVFLGLVQMFPEDYVSESWKDLPYAVEDFLYMEDLGFRPSHVIRTFGMSMSQIPHFSTNRPAYFQLRNPSNRECLERIKRIGGCRLYAPTVVVMSTHCLFTFFERLKVHEWDPEDSFAEPMVCERSVKDWPTSVRLLWKADAYGIVSNCAFSVNRRHGLTPPNPPAENHRKTGKGGREFFSRQEFIAGIYQSARLYGNLYPLIELSEREATEIVYLTALCRGRVRTMDEFNAAFVPKGETFLVRLTVPECETEIGRMLYDLARKRGLLGQKGKGAWK